MTLKYVLEAWNRIAEEPSTNNKETIIQESLGIEHFAHATFLALNNLLKFKVRDTEYNQSGNTSVTEIWKVLSYLAGKSGADAKDKIMLNKAASIDVETVEAVNRILKGDLRCGAGRTLFRKYIVNIPKHEAMLCIDDLDKFIKTAGSFENIASSVKLDGVRVWAIVEDDKVKYVSRNGIEFPNFSGFDEEVLEAFKKIYTTFPRTSPIIFDGEIISRDKDFQRCLSNFRKLKEADTSIFDFRVFDIVCDLPFIERYKLISRIFPRYDARVTFVSHMLGILTSEEDILELLEDVTRENEEGLVLKTLDGPYEYKRSNHWCKIKKFYSEDIQVIGLELGKGKYADVLGKLICDRDGVEVKVGSGFSDDERKEFLENPPEKIEVQYQEITKDKSLRFPVFVRIRMDI
jgi:DNA ligase-1